MPEGHSIRILANRFSLLVGTQVTTCSPQGRFTEGAEVLSGCTVTATDAHGKHLFLEFDHEWWLRVHLGLYGRFDWGAGTPSSSWGQVRLRLVWSEEWVDLRGPAACELISDDQKEAIHRRLGVDPLRPDWDIDLVQHWILARSVPVGSMLMNQGIIAGVGNVYRAEVLFRARMDPHLPCSELEPAQLRGLWEDLKVIMADGVDTGCIVTTLAHHRPPAADPWDRGNYVYRRHGRPCHVCGTIVSTEPMDGRKMYWCSSCQPSHRKTVSAV